jgi:hypothetical protein
VADSSKFVVFYSWQSDLPDETNRRLIREGLRTASSRLEEEYAADGIHVVVDEATRDVPGSPNIPQTIIDKIRVADVFVGDVTTINANRPDGQRACPNPNVMIELGYAIAQLGWGRIVMLFNKAHGSFPNDVPFDIDRHRLSDYEFTVPLIEDTEGTKKQRAKRFADLKKPLFDLLYDALKDILLHRPPKPTEADKLTPEARKRRRDIQTLNSILATIHVPTMDKFLYDIQIGTVSHKIFHFWETFNGVVSSNLFHFYDPTLASLVADLHDSWGGSLKFGGYFTPSATAQSYSFDAPGDIFTPQQKEAWDKMQKVAQNTGEAFRGLLKYVRENYVEVDIEQTSKDAWLEYVEFHSENEAEG